MTADDRRFPQGGEAEAEQQLPDRPPGEAEDELYMAAADRDAAMPLPEDTADLERQQLEQK